MSFYDIDPQVWDYAVYDWPLDVIMTASCLCKTMLKSCEQDEIWRKHLDIIYPRASLLFNRYSCKEILFNMSKLWFIHGSNKNKISDISVRSTLILRNRPIAYIDLGETYHNINGYRISNVVSIVWGQKKNFTIILNKNGKLFIDTLVGPPEPILEDHKFTSIVSDKRCAIALRGDGVVYKIFGIPKIHVLLHRISWPKDTIFKKIIVFDDKFIILTDFNFVVFSNKGERKYSVKGVFDDINIANGSISTKIDDWNQFYSRQMIAPYLTSRKMKVINVDRNIDYDYKLTSYCRFYKTPAMVDFVEGNIMIGWGDYDKEK